MLFNNFFSQQIEGERLPHSNTFIFYVNDKYGIKDDTNKILVNSEYDRIVPVGKEIYLLKNDNKYNVFYINEIVTKISYDKVDFVKWNDAFVAKNGNLSDIYVKNSENKYKIALQTDKELIANNGNTMILKDKFGKKVIYFDNGKTIDDKYSYLNIFNNVLLGSINYKWGLIKNGKEITPFIYDNVDINIEGNFLQTSKDGYLINYKTIKYFVVQLNNKFGIIDVNGKIIRDTKYDKITYSETDNAYLLLLNKKIEKIFLK